MSIYPIELTGTLFGDGTLKLDKVPSVPVGRVTLQLQPQGEPQPSAENWWQLLQRLREEREARGYTFLNEQQMDEHISWLHDDDDRIDRLHRELEQVRGRQESA